MQASNRRAAQRVGQDVRKLYSAQKDAVTTLVPGSEFIYAALEQSQGIASWEEGVTPWSFAGAVPLVSIAKGGIQGFKSFSAFKRAMGSAGEGQAWHHIVEQTPGNVGRFGAETIHNTGNLMKLPHGTGSIHNRLSGHYSSIQDFTNGQTVRQWLSTQSYQAQYDYGIKMLKQFGWTP